MKTNDLDGSVSLSKVVSIEKKNLTTVKIYPSVSSGFLTIENASTFDIINALGQVVLSQKQSILDTIFNIQALQNGIYVVRGVDTEGVLFVQKIVKN